MTKFFPFKISRYIFLWNNWWFQTGWNFVKMVKFKVCMLVVFSLGAWQLRRLKRGVVRGFFEPQKNGSKPHRVAKLERKEQHDFEDGFVSFLKWSFESFGLKRPKSCIFFKGISSWRLLCCRMKWKRDLIEMRRERLAMPRIQVGNVSSFSRMFDYDVLDNISATAWFFQILMFSFRGQHLQRKL